MGRRRPDSDEPRGGGVSPTNALPVIGDRDRLDADHIGHVEPLGDAVRRRFDGRFPVDPFGLDPQLVDLVAPAVRVGDPRRRRGR